MTFDPYTSTMNETQRAFFYAEYQRFRKDELAGILFAFFLGGFGAHHFYLKRNGLGILYACFCWSGVPSLIALVECFFMPGRVREYNTLLALQLQDSILRSAAVEGAPVVLEATPYGVRACAQCNAAMEADAVFCTKCGARAA